MKKNNMIISLLFIISLIYSCKDEIKEKDILIKVDEINLQRPENAIDFYGAQFSDSDSCNLIVLVDRPYSSDRSLIYLYDLNNRKFLKSIRVKANIDVNAFYYKNKDSIYISPQYGTDIFMIDDSGEIKDTVFYIPDVYQLAKVLKRYDLGRGMEYSYRNTAPMIVEEKKIFVFNATDPYIHPENQRSLLILYPDKDTLLINPLIGKVPPELLNEENTLYPYTLFISYARNNKNQTIVNFGPEHKLRIYSDSTLIKTVDAASKHIKKLPEFMPREKIGLDFINERFYNGTFYLGIHYDKYRDVYVRTAKISEILKSKDGILDNQNWKYTIMILDSEFNVISEQVFDNKEYGLFSLLITKDGIMLKKPDDLSGITRYSLFKYNPEYFID